MVGGRLDRLDRLPDGTRRIVEYKSYEKQLQARLYARILEKADGTRTDYAIPHFGDRRWIGPGDKPDDAEQDRRIREIRDALAGGEFPAPADGDSPFDFALFARRDLREAAGRRRGGSEAVRNSPAPFPPDRAAREAAADPARNVVLRASAGTGKTTVLTQRYLRLVECGVPPRNILALTFTRKAAQEMKDRIVAELGSAERRRALAGRGDLAEVNIATLDAFTLGPPPRVPRWMPG